MVIYWHSQTFQPGRLDDDDISASKGSVFVPPMLLVLFNELTTLNFAVWIGVWCK